MANINGTTGADLLIGTLEDDIIDAINGNDSIFAGANNDSADIMAGGSGDDIIGGGLGNDVLIGDNHVGATVLGNLGASGSNTLFGGAGDDLVITGTYTNAGTDATLATAGGNALGGFISGTGNSTAWLGDGNDIGYGAEGDDEIGGGAGDDEIYAGNGNNTVYAGAGADVINTGNGDDTIFGGSGSSTITTTGGTNTIFGGAGDAVITGGAGVDNIFAGAGSNTVTGGAGADVFGNGVGNAGNTTITDFTLGEDVLGLENFASSFADGAAVVAAMADSADGAVLTLAAGQTVTFAGLTVADFNTTTENWVNLTGTPEGTPVTFALTPATGNVSEGTTQTYTVTASRAVAADTAVEVRLLPGNGTSADQGTSTTNTKDFGLGAFNAVTATIAAGQTTATVDVTPSNDGITELPESFSVEASVGGTIVSTVSGEVLDNTAPDVASATFTLTTGVDAGTAFVGGAGNDTFIGTSSKTSPTINLGDSLDGGAGTDTFQIISNLGGAIPSVETTSIEKYKVTSSANDTLAVSGQSTGLSNVNFVGGSNTTFTLSGIGTGVGVGLVNDAQQLTLTFDSVSGTSDSASISLNGAKSTASVKADGIETFNVTTSGAKSTLADLTGNTGKTLNITGSQDLTITTALANTFTTVDGSAATGELNFGVATGGDAKITTGSGDDRVDMAGGLDANDTVDLGAGTDTIAVSSADLSASATVTALKNVKNAEVVETTATGAVTVDGAALDAAFSTFKVSGAMAAAVTTTTDGAISVDAGNMSDADVLQISADRAGSAVAAVADNSTNVGSDGVELTSVLDTGSNVANLELLGGVDIKGAAGGESTVTTNNGGTGGVGVDASTIETLNILSDGSAGNTIAGGDGGATLDANVGDAGASVQVNTNGKIVVTGDQDLNLGTIAGTNATVDGSAFTGKLTVTGEAGNNTIKGGSGADILDGGAGQDVLTGGDGADTFKFVGDANVSGGTPNATTFDTITDFNTGGSDKIDWDLTLGVETATTAAVATIASINAEGIASFHTSDDTLSERITAVQNAIVSGTESDGDFAVFEHSGDSYVFVNGDAGGLSNTDALIKLVDVTGLSDTTIDGSGDLTIA